MSSSDYLKLFKLVRNGDVNGLETFLSAPDVIDLNHENERTHLTPLMVACIRPSSNLEVIDLLIEKGAEVDYQTKDHYKSNSALMKAAGDGNVEAVKCLIKHGAQVDMKNENRKSALEFGCVNGNVEVVKVLLEVEGVKGLSSAFSAAGYHNHTELV